MSANSTIVVELAPGLLLGHAEDRGVEVDVLAAGELRVEAGAGGDQAGDPAAGQHACRASGRMIPLTSLSRVLLPEPLSPIRPIDSPCSTVNETSSRALKVSLMSRPFAHRDRHLLEGAVVAQRERPCRRCRRRWTRWRTSSEALRDPVLEAGEDQLGDDEHHHARHRAPGSRSRTGWRAGRVAAVAAGSSVVPTQKARWKSSTASAIGLQQVERRRTRRTAPRPGCRGRSSARRSARSWSAC